jgi:hypothetical protein
MTEALSIRAILYAKLLNNRASLLILIAEPSIAVQTAYVFG